MEVQVLCMFFNRLAIISSKPTTLTQGCNIDTENKDYNCYTLLYIIEYLWHNEFTLIFVLGTVDVVSGESRISLSLHKKFIMCRM